MTPIKQPEKKKKRLDQCFKSIDIYTFTKNCGIHLRTVCHTLLFNSSLFLNESVKKMNINIIFHI